MFCLKKVDFLFFWLFLMKSIQPQQNLAPQPCCTPPAKPPLFPAAHRPACPPCLHSRRGSSPLTANRHLLWRAPFIDPLGTRGSALSSTHSGFVLISSRCMQSLIRGECCEDNWVEHSSNKAPGKHFYQPLFLHLYWPVGWVFYMVMLNFE